MTINENGDASSQSEIENGGKPPDEKKVNPAEALESELAKSKSDFLYLAAEFDNYKKTVIKERSDLRKYGSEKLVVDLLNVLDILDQVLNSEVTAENLDSFKKGLAMTVQEFKSTLSRHGVVEMNSDNGNFDPTLHEALSSEESDQVPSGQILRTFKKPYKLHDRVIRPGQVIVARAKST